MREWLADWLIALPASIPPGVRLLAAVVCGMGLGMLSTLLVTEVRHTWRHGVDPVGWGYVALMALTVALLLAFALPLAFYPHLPSLLPLRPR